MRIRAEFCFYGGQFLSDQSVEIRDGRIRDVRPATDQDPPYDRTAHLVTSGFVDLQVNGGGGVLFNTTPTAEGIIKIRDTHRACGTGAILPTVISDTPEIMERATSAFLELWGEPGLLGLHFEGPHINPEKRGIHSPAAIRPLDNQTLQQIKRLRACDIPVMLSLAPELSSDEDLSLLSDLGVVLSAGHSLASYADSVHAMARGVRCATHLYNAMPGPESRNPGLVTAALLEGLWWGIIADGHHVDYKMIELAWRGGQPDRMCLVSDAMPTVSGPPSFTLYGRDMTLTANRLTDADGTLAGAHLTVCEAVRNLATHTQIPLESLLYAATLNPLRAMALDPSRLDEIVDGVWLALDADLNPLSDLS